MSLNIFDLEDSPKPSSNKRFADDIVGSIKGGYVAANRPVASETLIFTSDDMDVITPLAEKFGGEVEELQVERGDPYRVISDASELVLTLTAAGSLRSRFALYGQAGLVFATDGDTITEGETYGGAKVGDQWTEKPETLKQWKDRATNGRAPKPDITLTGKIEGFEDFGKFRYRTSGWSLVRDLPEIERMLDEAEAAGKSIRVKLSLGKVEFTTKGGDEVAYTRPYIEVL